MMGISYYCQSKTKDRLHIQTVKKTQKEKLTDRSIGGQVKER